MGQAIFFTGPDSPVHLQQAMFPASSSGDTLTFLFIIDRRTKGGECTKEREKEYYNTEEHIPCEPIHSSTPHARGVIDFRTTSSHTMPNTIYYLFVFLSWQLWLSGRAPFPLPPTPHLSAPPGRFHHGPGCCSLSFYVCIYSYTVFGYNLFLPKQPRKLSQIRPGSAWSHSRSLLLWMPLHAHALQDAYLSDRVCAVAILHTKMMVKQNTNALMPDGDTGKCPRAKRAFAWKKARIPCQCSGRSCIFVMFQTRK